MLRRILLYTILILTGCLTDIQTHAQTIGQKTRQAYAGLRSARGYDRITLLNEVAKYHLIDSTALSLELSRKAVALADSLNDLTAGANSLVLMARGFWAQNKPDSCLIALNQARAIKLETQNPADLETIYHFYARVHQARGDVAEALEYYDTAAFYAQQNSNNLREGKIYEEMAHCYRTLNNNDKMLALLDKSYDIYMKSTDTLEFASYIISLGVSYSDQGQLEKANEVYIKAIAMAEKAGDSLSLGYLYSNLAGICGSFTFKEKTRDYNLKSLEIFRDIRNERGMAYALNSLGQYYSDQKDYPVSMQYYKEAATLKEKARDWQGACFVYCNLAELYALRGDFSSAKMELIKAEELSAKADDGLTRTVVWFSYGQYYSLRQDYAQARQYYIMSLEKAEKLRLYDFVTKSLSAISEQYQAEGRPEEALAFYKRYTTAKDSIEKAINVMNMAELQLRFETEKKDNLLRELMASREKRSYLFGNIIIAVLLIVASLFFLMRMSIVKHSGYNPKLILAGSRARRSEFSGLTPVSEQASKPSLTPDLQKQIWHELNHLMERDRLYLNSNIKLSHLADKLNTNTSYLSKVINAETEDNFCNYLNQFRIREAQKMLSDSSNHHLTIEGIAQSVGFNSKSAFNSAFKKFSSITPREFLAGQSRSDL